MFQKHRASFYIGTSLAIVAVLSLFFGRVSAQSDGSRMEYSSGPAAYSGGGGGDVGGGSVDANADNAGGRYANGNDGQCGPAAKSYPLNASGFIGQFCSQGVMDQALTFPKAGATTTWMCSGYNGGVSTQCVAVHQNYDFQEASTTGTSTIQPRSVQVQPQRMSFFELLMQNLKDYFGSLLRKGSRK